jgi:putative ABC transport system permease protein
MRALGARRSTVRTIVLLESILLSLAGGLAGWLLGRALIAAMSPAIAARTGVMIGFAPPITAELALVPALILLAALAGYLPAMTAYRTDVAKVLASAA